MKPRMGSSVARSISYGGIVTALSLVLLYLVTFFPTMEFAFAAAASVLLSIVVIRCSKATALGVYIATALLSFLLLPSKIGMLSYVAFFGYYPILKAIAEQQKSSLMQWVIKICLFNLAFLIAFYGFAGLLALPDTIWNKIYVLLPVANVAFLMYDYVFTGLIRMIVRRFRW